MTYKYNETSKKIKYRFFDLKSALKYVVFLPKHCTSIFQTKTSFFQVETSKYAKSDTAQMIADYSKSFWYSAFSVGPTTELKKTTVNLIGEVFGRVD